MVAESVAVHQWTRPLVLLNALALLGILLSVCLVLGGDALIAYLTYLITNAPEALYVTLLIHHHG